MGRLRSFLSGLRYGSNGASVVAPDSRGEPATRAGSAASEVDQEEQWRTTPEWITVSSGPLEGHRLLIPPNPAWQKMAEGQYEPFVFHTLNRHGDFAGATVWDVGAHIGFHALAFASLVGESGRVIAFEPNPYNADRIRQHLAENPDLAGRVTLRTEALSSSDGEETFVFSSDLDLGYSSGSHVDNALAPEEQEKYEAFDRMPVRTIRADALLRGESVPAPDLIKMDVEGAELLVLQGGSELLSSTKPVLLIEVHHIVTMFHVQNLLYKAGYSVEIVDEAESSASRCHILARPSAR